MKFRMLLFNYLYTFQKIIDNLDNRIEFEGVIKKIYSVLDIQNLKSKEKTSLKIF